ncbi:MAG TPA: hypothetical protein VGL91_01430 [Acidobacteriota bacterium]|jgi:hypothetical protein
MKQLTLRGFEKELEHEIRKLARRRGISLNRAAVELLRRGAGLANSDAKTDVVGNSLDALIGTWSERDERDFLKTVSVFEEIDKRFWR